MTMTPKLRCILLLAVVVVSGVTAQSDDIPVENDNQFPPENQSVNNDGTLLEGSGDGIINEPLSVTPENTPPPLLEDIQNVAQLSEVVLEPASGDVCPEPCVCNTEGGSENFVVDCSGYSLTKFPSPLNPRTTTLNVQNNKITEIPKDVSALKNLKVLNANNNFIMDLAAGSVSELAELTALKLGNNRLIEFPTDLKNSFTLTKLEELDLGGNDMRTVFKPETFSNFKSLRTLTLPNSTPELTALAEDVCKSLKGTLETVCFDTCKAQTYECLDAPEKLDEDLFDAMLPGLIAFAEHTDFTSNSGNVLPEQKSPNSRVNDEAVVPLPTNADSGTAVPTDISSRFAINKEKENAVPAQLNTMVEKPKSTSTDTEVDLKFGATTIDTKTGGVDKSVIGIIVAGMVVVVAGIVIKKNWSSIRKRFSSSSRTPTERVGANANGAAAPEEVPLQDKSPV